MLAYSFYRQSHDLFPYAKDSPQFHLTDNHGAIGTESNAGSCLQTDLQNEPYLTNVF